MSIEKFLPVFLFIAVVATVQFTNALLCDDLSHDGCVAFASAKPDLCMDPNLGATCKRFCKQCPLECYHCPQAVRDPDMCNVTQPCGANQTCVLSELLASDGHHEYIMTCADKGICSGLPFGFGPSGFGKRELQVGEFNIDLNAFSQSDVSFKCCDTDNCNKEKLLMSTTPPTTTPQGPQGCGKDIAIALDTSGSIGSTNFRHMLDFVAQIVNIIEISPQHSQVAVDTFASRSTVQWYLNTFVTRDQILNRLKSLHYTSGATITEAALAHVVQNIFTSQHGDRPNAKNVVLVVTDGHSTHPQQTLNAAQILHGESSDIVAVGVGRIGNSGHNELISIATDSNHEIEITNFSQLPSIVSRVVGLLCA